MNLETKITIALKEAMKSKDKTRLIALRAIKSAIILQKTQKSNSSDLLVEDEMRILQKLVKQRKESADIFLKQDRGDLAEPELGEAKIIQEFLPESLSEDEITPIVKSIIQDLGASNMSDMGKVMGVSSKKLLGKADGKIISTIVRKLLS